MAPDLSKRLNEQPHRRFNPLLREWVLVSPHRLERPWQGLVEHSPAQSIAAYEPECYLCPGNQRAGGKRNPPYDGVFVFDNDFPALLESASPFTPDDDGLIVARAERGICRVVCFSPDHSLSLARMPATAVRRVVDEWAAQFADLAGRPWIRSVQIFENRGEMMGASNAHPHCQIWATGSLPNDLVHESDSQRDYLHNRSRCLLCDYLARELAAGERIVCENNAFVALVPFWAVWPFETTLLPRRHATGLDELDATGRDALADILKRLTSRYDNLFGTPFPYTMGFHQRPAGGAPHPEFHLHAHFYPPLLRSATVRKYMVGYELLGEPQRDLTPESAAERLRSAREDV